MSQQFSKNDYIQWAQGKGLLPSDLNKFKLLYESNLSNINNTIEKSDVRSDIGMWLHQAGHKYLHDTNFILSDSFELKILLKPFDSTIEKLYRKDCLLNNKFNPDNIDNLINHRTLYNRIDDLFRTRIITRYVDGPGFVVDFIRDKLASTHNIEINERKLATQAGYHGQHVYIPFDSTILIEDDNGLVTKEIVVYFEIQFYTRMQDLMRELTHGIYEQNRVTRGKNQDWKWDFGSQEFKAGYLGQTLHMLDAMLLELRDTVDTNKDVDDE